MASSAREWNRLSSCGLGLVMGPEEMGFPLMPVRMRAERNYSMKYFKPLSLDLLSGRES